MFIQKHSVTSILIAFLVAACGGSTSESSVPVVLPSFSLSVSDAPVDDLSEVVVCFNQIELKGGSEDIIFTVGNETEMMTENNLCLDNNDEVIPNTVGVDLLKFTGSDSIALVNDITIEAGNYTQLRLIISEGSYGIDAQTGEKIDVRIPSNELKLDGFTAALGSIVDFTLEFDLNKAMTNPVGQAGYILKPRGVRLIDNAEAGHITGTVSETLLLDNQCAPLSDPNAKVASVYLYVSPDLNIDALEDNGGNENSNLPYASSAVVFNSEESNYSFEIGYIKSGEYTIAVTCETEDDPEVDDEINFITLQNVTVTAAKTPVQVIF
jgi:hypothetical protein